MKCPHCSQEHPDTCKFCPVTGKAIVPGEGAAELPKRSTSICPNCQRVVLENQKYCPSCGYPVTPVPGEQVDETSVQGKVPSSQQHCPRCGSILPSHLARFCPACGAVLNLSASLADTPLPPVDTITKQLQVEEQGKARTGKRGMPLLFYYVGALIIVAVLLAFLGIRLGWLSGNGSPLQPKVSQVNVQAEVTAPASAVAVLPLPLLSPSSTSKNSPISTSSSTSIPTRTTSPTNPSSPSPTLIPSATSTPIPTVVNQVDNSPLLYIPAGKFTMGSDSNIDPYFWGAEAPAHEVFVSEYYMYQLEVSNRQYAQCVAAHQCPRPQQTYSRTRREYYGNPRFDEYPVIYVTYQMASSYCIWAGGRLPSEAEWEKAARGTDKRLFPWGSTPPDANQANYNASGVGDTMPVGSYPSGISAYGALDMGGNVIEWTYDRFDEGYYRYSSLDNPFGPTSGTRRVIRGGSWASGLDGLRTVARASLQQDSSVEMLGFRCILESLP